MNFEQVFESVALPENRVSQAQKNAMREGWNQALFQAAAIVAKGKDPRTTFDEISDLMVKR